MGGTDGYRILPYEIAQKIKSLLYYILIFEFDYSYILCYYSVIEFVPFQREITRCLSFVRSQKV